MAKKSSIDVVLRLRNARQFKKDAESSAKSIDKFGERGKKAGDKMKSMGAGMSKNVSAPIGIALGFATKAAMGFEKQMASLGAVSGASSGQMEQLRKSAMKAGADTVFSAKEAAVAQTELAKGGLSANQILRGGLSGALALASAGELELGQAAEITANSLNLFSMKGSEATRIADMMATAANATTADVADFGMAMSQGGGVAKMAGYDFKETMVILEALAKTGVKNSDAGTSLKTSMLQLLGPSEKQMEVQEQLGLKFTNSAGAMKSASQISEMLRKKLGGMTQAQRTATLKTLAGTDGVRTLNALYTAGPKKLDKYRAGLAKQGTAAEVAKKKNATLAGQWEAAKGSLETLGISVGTILIPPLSRLAKIAASTANKISGLPKGTQTAIVGFGLFLAAIGPVTFALGSTVNGLLRVRRGLRGMKALFQRAFGTAPAVATQQGAAAGTAFTNSTVATVDKKRGRFRSMGRGLGRVVGAAMAPVAVALLLSEAEKAFRNKHTGGKTGERASGRAGTYGSPLDWLKGGNALGGVIPRGGVSWVGERGPELAIAGQSGTRIMPAGGSRVPQLQAAVAASGAAGGGGGGTIRVPVFLDGRQIAEAVARSDRAKEARR